MKEIKPKTKKLCKGITKLGKPCQCRAVLFGYCVIHLKNYFKGYKKL